MKDFSNVLNNPFNITWCNNSLRVLFICLLIYICGVILYISSRKNYRRGEEHGSAKWGNAKIVNKKYHQFPQENNKLLTQNVSIGLNAKKHRRNLNTLVCGGSGAGKTRFYCKPNIMQCNTSFVVLDPKGEIVRDTGKLLEKKGYEVRVLDLINMEKSHCYNPFVYLKSDNDVQKLVTNLFKSTTPKGSSSNDPFWDTAAQMLLLALMFYLKYEAPVDEQNFPMVMEMLRAGDVKEDDDMYVSPLDMLFNTLEDENPNHIAIKYYRSYHSGSGKTLKSIQITLASRLEKFNLESLARLSQTDELDLSSIGERKTALFAINPLSTFAGEPTQNVGRSFLKSYSAVCLEGAIIVLSCIIFSLFASTPPVVDAKAAAVTQVWKHIGELIFNMLVLVGTIKISDRVVREMMGL